MPAIAELLSLFEGCSVVDLAQVSHPGMPGSPNHPPLRLYPIRRHGDVDRSDGSSATNEVLILGSHTGTHVDALGHVSMGGRCFGDADARSLSTHEGLASLDAPSLGVFLRPAHLVDVPRLLGVELLEPGFAIDGEHIEAALGGVLPAENGDFAALIRTGWGTLWDDPDGYVGEAIGVPGLSLDGARYLIERGASLIGGDTATVEVRVAGGFHDPLPVHTHCLVEAGVPLIENLNLEGLPGQGAHPFLLIVLPLPIRGASGSPVRPVAIVDA